MANKYRIFYDSHYRGDVLDFTEDIEANSNEDAVQKAKQFIQKKNGERKEETRQNLIRRVVPNAGRFTDEQLLAGNYFKLTGVSRITETLTTVEVKKEDLQSIYVS